MKTWKIAEILRTKFLKILENREILSYFDILAFSKCILYFDFFCGRRRRTNPKTQWKDYHIYPPLVPRGGLVAKRVQENLLRKFAPVHFPNFSHTFSQNLETFCHFLTISAKFRKIFIKFSPKNRRFHRKTRMKNEISFSFRQKFGRFFAEILRS